MAEQVASLSSEQAQLLDKVVRLRPETLDSDLLEEYSIRMLGHGTSAKGVILLENKS